MNIEATKKIDRLPCDGCFNLCESCILYEKLYNRPNYVKDLLEKLKKIK